MTTVMIAATPMIDPPLEQKVFSLNFGGCENHEDTYREFAAMSKDIKARNTFDGEIINIGTTTLIGSRTLAVLLFTNISVSYLLEYTILQHALEYKDIPVLLHKSVDDLGVCIELASNSDWIIYIGDTPRIGLDDMNDNLAKLFVEKKYSFESIHGIMSNMLPVYANNVEKLDPRWTLDFLRTLYGDTLK